MTQKQQPKPVQKTPHPPIAAEPTPATQQAASEPPASEPDQVETELTQAVQLNEMNAKAVHDISSALLAGFALIRETRKWDELSESEKNIHRSVVSEALNTDVPITPSVLHQLWCEEMRNRGWDQGELHVEGKRNPYICQWHLLPMYIQAMYHAQLAAMRIISEGSHLWSQRPAG